MHGGRRVAALGLVVALAACSRAPKVPPLDVAAHRAQWQAWHAGRQLALDAPGGPRSLTGLVWLPRDQPRTIGGDSTAGIRLTGTDVPPAVGTLARHGPADDTLVTFTSADTTLVWVDGAHPERAELRTDAARAPSRVEAGDAGFWLIRRGDSVGVRTWRRLPPDPVPGAVLDTFPLDPAFRVGARFVPYRTPRPLRVMTEAGVEQEQLAVGELRFTLDGGRRRLVAWQGSSPRELFVVFSDRTSGSESYGFRYLQLRHAPPPASGKPPREDLVLDFNFAYSPDCAFTRFATCPLPPRQNRLAVRVTAGERMPKPAPAPRVAG